MASIARLVQTSSDRVREMIHRFNEKGMSSLDPAWAGGRPRLITTTDRELSVSSAKTRPTVLGQPFSRWSLRKLRGYLATKAGHRVVISFERLRQILVEADIAFQATKTWRESPDPAKEEKLARIEYVVERHRDRTLAFDEFGPLAIKPEGGNNNVELCFTPTYGSWAHPIEAHFGPLREFVIANSDHPDHPTLTAAIRRYLRWRNANTRDPRVLEAERKHRAQIRGEARRRWGHPSRRTA